MKKINLFLMVPLASLMFACSDYVGELDDQHDEYVKLEEELSNWTSGCECVLEDDGISDGVYDPKSRVEHLRWTIVGCSKDASLTFGKTETLFGEESFLSDGDDFLDLELGEVALKALLNGDYTPTIVAGRNDGLAAHVLDCPAVEFVANPDFDKSDDAKSSSSEKAESSSSEKTESSSSSEKVTSSSSAIVKPDLPCGDLWCGTDATGSAGVVNTGFDNGTETSGLWYWYDDNCAPNNGDSKITFPDVKEEDKYGNFFGPLADKYGGITGSVTLGNNYEYPFVGLGFNLVSENQEGADITEWDGVCLTYSSTANFQVELTPEDENVVTEYNNYKATVAKSSGLKTIDLTWDKFKQETGWGKTIDRSQVLKSIASVKLKFSSISGSSGDFFIYSIGRRGTCDGSRRDPVSSSSSASNAKENKCGDLWCGATPDYKVNAKSLGAGDYGYWFAFDDNQPIIGGDSKVELADGFSLEGTNTSPLIFYKKAVAGTIKIGKAYEYPFAGVGFTLEGKGNWNSPSGSSVDVSKEDGFCVTYESDVPFQMVLVPSDQQTLTEYNDYKAALTKTSAGVLNAVDVPWSKFKQESGWGNSVAISEVLKELNQVNFRFTNSGNFKIYSVGRLGTCGGKVGTPVTIPSLGTCKASQNNVEVGSQLRLEFTPNYTSVYTATDHLKSTYKWNYGSDAIVDGSSSGINSAYFSVSKVGSHASSVVVTMADGVSQSIPCDTVTIVEPTVYPVSCECDVDIFRSFVGSTSTWSLLCTSESPITSYEWTGVSANSDEASASYKFTSAKKVTPTVKVTNQSGGTEVVACPAVEAVERAPITGCECTAEKPSVYVGEENGKWTISGCTSTKTLYYAWTGVNNISNIDWAYNTFDEVGVAQPSVVITNEDNTEVSLTCPAVEAVERAPITGCSCVANKTNAYVGETVTWTAEGCTSNAYIGNYQWNGTYQGANGKVYDYEVTSAGTVSPTLNVYNEDGVMASVTCPAVEAVERAPITGCECTAEKPSVYVGEENGKWTISGCTSTKTLYYAWTGVNNISNIDWAYNTFDEVGVAQPSVVITNEDDTEVSLTCPAVEAVERGPITDCECKAFVPYVRYGNSNYWTVENCVANNTIDTYTWTGVSADPELPSKGVSGAFGADMSLTPTVRVTDVRGNSVDVTCETASTIVCGNLWCGSGDAHVVTDDARVPWYVYDDNKAPNNGNTKISVTSAVSKEDSMFVPTADPRIEYTVTLGNAYEYPFAGIGFNLTEKGDTGVDITSWQGICLTYKSTAAFAIEMNPEDENNFTEYNNYKATASKATSVTVVDLPWSKFKQETGWGRTVALEDFLKEVAGIRFKHTASGTTTIYQVGRYGSCDTAVIE